MAIKVGSLVQFLPPAEIDEALKKAGVSRDVRERFIRCLTPFQTRIYTVIKANPAFCTTCVELRYGTETVRTLGSTLIGIDCLREISKYPSNYAKQVSG